MKYSTKFADLRRLSCETVCFSALRAAKSKQFHSSVFLELKEKNWLDVSSNRLKMPNICLENSGLGGLLRARSARSKPPKPPFPSSVR